jgi:hypothetical protein
MATIHALLANGLMLCQGRSLTDTVTDNGKWLTALVSQPIAIVDVDAMSAAQGPHRVLPVPETD